MFIPLEKVPSKVISRQKTIGKKIFRIQTTSRRVQDSKTWGCYPHLDISLTDPKVTYWMYGNLAVPNLVALKKGLDALDSKTVVKIAYTPCYESGTESTINLDGANGIKPKLSSAFVRVDVTVPCPDVVPIINKYLKNEEAKKKKAKEKRQALAVKLNETTETQDIAGALLTLKRAGLKVITIDTDK